MNLSKHLKKASSRLRFATRIRYLFSIAKGLTSIHHAGLKFSESTPATDIYSFSILDRRPLLISNKILVDTSHLQWKTIGYTEWLDTDSKTGEFEKVKVKPSIPKKPHSSSEFHSISIPLEIGSIKVVIRISKNSSHKLWDK
ncbi:18470_t:CDS:2 [Dentiscutata erythropus]|uniref:18470_t:CDS:1 n=1 Tax=Dentiscutata erythropus TaxID=1348616 RepID=A0A9N9G1U1_9GLOM|nr:18470_t:CDS:2 [Dentiscutata erythropus]